MLTSIVDSTWDFSTTPNQITLHLSDDVPVTAASVSMVNTTTGLSLPASAQTLAYDSANKLLTVTLDGATNDLGVAGVVPDGDWHFTLAGITSTVDCPALSGDLNDDGVVDQTDLTTLRSHIGAATVTYADGDLNRDGVVNATDWLDMTPGKRLAPTPTASTAFSASIIGTSPQDHVQLAWSPWTAPPSRTLSYYRIQRLIPNGTWIKIADVAVPATTYTDTGVVAGTYAQYKIKAFYTNGSSDGVWCPVEAITTAAAAPRNLLATSHGSYTYFTWGLLGDSPAHFLIAYTTNGDFSNPAVMTVNGTGRSATISSLDPAKIYQFMLWPTDADDNVISSSAATDNSILDHSSTALSVDMAHTSYDYTGFGQFIHVRFTNNVTSSLRDDTLHIENATTGTDVPTSRVHFIANDPTGLPTWKVLPDANGKLLGDGWYIATIDNQDVYGTVNGVQQPLDGSLTISCPTLAGSFTYALTKNPNSLTTIQGPDLGQYTNVVLHYGQNPAAYTDGDFDYDGEVALGDYTTVINNYGATLSAPPVSPGTLSLSNIGDPVDGKIVVQWVAPTAPTGLSIVSYRLQISQDGQTFSNLVDDPDLLAVSTAMNYTATGLQDGCRYWFRVRAMYSDGHGNFTTSAYTVKSARNTQLIAPAAASVSATSATRIHATWTYSGSNADNFIIRAVPEGVSINTVTPVSVPNNQQSNQSYTIPGLIPQKHYTIFISAANSTTESGAAFDYATTPPVPTLAADVLATITNAVSGKTPSANTRAIFTGTGASLTPNPNLFAAGYDFSCVAVTYDADRSVGGFPGTLISSDCVVMASHTNPTLKVPVLFISPNGTHYQRTVAQVFRITDSQPNSGDVAICVLDAPVPTPSASGALSAPYLITPAKILPDNYLSYLQHNQTVPVVRVNQNANLYIDDWIGGDAFTAAEETGLAPWNTETVYRGDNPPIATTTNLPQPLDSGNGVFALIGGQTVLLGAVFQSFIDSGYATFPNLSTSLAAVRRVTYDGNRHVQLCYATLSGHPSLMLSGPSTYTGSSIVTCTAVASALEIPDDAVVDLIDNSVSPPAIVATSTFLNGTAIFSVPFSYIGDRIYASYAGDITKQIPSLSSNETIYGQLLLTGSSGGLPTTVPPSFTVTSGDIALPNATPVSLIDATFSGTPIVVATALLNGGTATFSPILSTGLHKLYVLYGGDNSANLPVLRSNIFGYTRVRELTLANSSGTASRPLQAFAVTPVDAPVPDGTVVYLYDNRAISLQPIASAIFSNNSATITANLSIGSHFLYVSDSIDGVPPVAKYLSNTLSITISPASDLATAPVVNGLLTASTAYTTDNPSEANFPNQRSMVNDVEYTFASAVDSSYFTVQVMSSDGQIVPTVVTAVQPLNGLSTKWDVSFSSGSSIVDGVYAIRLSTKNGGTGMTPDETDTFYRLFGDMNGVGCLGASLVVPDNIMIFNGIFGKEYGQVGYLPALDSDGTLSIDLGDFTLFQQDIGRDFTAFGATI